MCAPVALFSFLSSRLQHGARVLCGTKVTVTQRSCSQPLPSTPHTCRDYVCTYASGSVFTLHRLHPSLPHPISSCSPPPPPPTPPPPLSSQRCGLLLWLATHQSANGLPGCSAALSRRSSGAAVSRARAAGDRWRCPDVRRLLQRTRWKCARPLSALTRPVGEERRRWLTWLAALRRFFCVVVEYVGAHKARKGF